LYASDQQRDLKLRVDQVGDATQERSGDAEIHEAMVAEENAIAEDSEEQPIQESEI
jgi:hypothetical protein